MCLIDCWLQSKLSLVVWLLVARERSVAQCAKGAAMSSPQRAVSLADTGSSVNVCITCADGCENRIQVEVRPCSCALGVLVLVLVDVACCVARCRAAAHWLLHPLITLTHNRFATTAKLLFLIPQKSCLGRDIWAKFTSVFDLNEQDFFGLVYEVGTRSRPCAACVHVRAH